MTRKAETTFAAGVHKLLPAQIYCEKMNNPFRGGTPDFYIEGPRCVQWIEYKFIVLPKRDSTLIVPTLSALQIDWLGRNYANGYDPLVVVGCGSGRSAGGVIFRSPRDWIEGVSCKDFRATLMSRQQLADYITRKTS